MLTVYVHMHTSNSNSTCIIIYISGIFKMTKCLEEHGDNKSYTREKFHGLMGFVIMLGKPLPFASINLIIAIFDYKIN